jgi:integrase
VPLKLRPPRKGRTPNFEIRGTHLRIRVEVSSGTDKRSLARKRLRQIEECIEQHGQYPAPESKPDPGEPTFLSAANKYMQDGGSKRYMAPLIRYFGETPLSEIGQGTIDAAASALQPDVTPATRARQVYTPASAVLHHVLKDKAPIIRRPKGAKGRMKTDFMWPEDAFAIIREADKIDVEFGLYLRLLLYTGIRKSEGLNMLTADVKPEERAAWLRTSKNEDPRMLKLRLDIVGPLFQHLKGHEGDRLFRFKDGGSFKHKLMRAKLAVCGIDCPKARPIGWKVPPHRLSFVGFHTFRHTWATWMRRYAGTDIKGLVATGNWRDEGSASRYSHVVAREEWDRVDNLPTMMGNIRGKTQAGGNS